MVVTQPSFLYYNGDRYLRQVPAQRQPYLYPLRSLRGRACAWRLAPTARWSGRRSFLAFTGPSPVAARMASPLGGEESISNRGGAGPVHDGRCLCLLC